MTKTITVDIRTRFLRDDQRCYILFPGSGYRHYEAMRDDQLVFLDLPGFPISAKESLKEADDLIKRVILSERIQEWHRTGRPADKPPAREIKNLSSHRETDARKRFAGLVRGFFETIRTGDIIIVPPSAYEHDVLFGEIVDDSQVEFAELPTYRTGLENPKFDKIPGRKVRWVARLPRHAAPSWLERKIPSPNPLRQIERSYFEEIFDIMYERYFFDGKFACKFSVASQEFSALDNFLFQQIVLYTAALHESRHEANINDIASKAISVVVSELEFSQDIPDQRISINSPGHIVVYAKNIIPLVAGVLMTIAAATGSIGEGIGKYAEIVIENSADRGQVSSQCVSDIQQEVIGDMVAMGYQRWQELCMIEEQARKRTQISSGIAAKPSSEAPKQDRLK